MLVLVITSVGAMFVKRIPETALDIIKRKMDHRKMLIFVMNALHLRQFGVKVTLVLNHVCVLLENIFRMESVNNVEHTQYTTGVLVFVIEGRIILPMGLVGIVSPIQPA
jgi:hypothetical protein